MAMPDLQQKQFCEWQIVSLLVITDKLRGNHECQLGQKCFRRNNINLINYNKKIIEKNPNFRTFGETLQPFKRLSFPVILSIFPVRWNKSL